MARVLVSARDMTLARRAKRFGMQHSLRIIMESRRCKHVPVSLAFAVVEQESSNGANVFGRDPTTSIPDAWKGKPVTLARYRHYKSRRARHGAQGVGPLQLTSPDFQALADRLGGCHIPKYNIRVGLSLLDRLIAEHGRFNGIAAYNAGEGGMRRGGGREYARSVIAKMNKWHRRLS